MTDSLKQQIDTHTIAAMKAGDKAKVGVLRLIKAALKQKEVDERITLDDTAIVNILNKMIKQRKDSIAQYETAKRQDLIDQEVYELGILEQYLPTQLTLAEIEKAVDQAITSEQATGMKDMGKVMAVLKAQYEGKADMAKMSQLVKSKLA